MSLPTFQHLIYNLMVIVRLKNCPRSYKNVTIYNIQVTLRLIVTDNRNGSHEFLPENDGLRGIYFIDMRAYI